MAIQWSPAVRNARLQAIETTVGTAARLILFTGAPPATTATAAVANTDVITYTLGSDWAGAPANGVVTLAGLPLVGNAGRAGTIGHYRVYDSTGLAGVCHEQGTVTASGGGGDMTVDNPNVTVGQEVRVTAFSKTEPGA